MPYVSSDHHGARAAWSYRTWALAVLMLWVDGGPRSPHADAAEPADTGFRLWDDTVRLPKRDEMPMLDGVRFSVIKPYEFDKDGYRFLHGVGLCFHEGRLYASFGHNTEGENTGAEEARGRISDDGGRTWGDIFTIDAGDDADLAVSHGVFLSHAGRLWAFMGAFHGTMKDVHTRAYLLDEATMTWEKKGTVVEGGFWPLQEPLRMDDGNWIMAGVRIGQGNPAAVAISHSDDFLNWDLVVIPSEAPNMWGESAVFLQGPTVVNIARWGGKPQALAAISHDRGRTWSPSVPSNLPMTTSKPYAGTLSTGEHYLIGTTTADAGDHRAPLTIAVTHPGKMTFSRCFVIRHAEHPGGPGESHPRAGLAYPYAVEHEGHLYVGYSNSGGAVGRTGSGRQRWNNNSAELAVIPLGALREAAASTR